MKEVTVIQATRAQVDAYAKTRRQFLATLNDAIKNLNTPFSRDLRLYRQISETSSKNPHNEIVQAIYEASTELATELRNSARQKRKDLIKGSTEYNASVSGSFNDYIAEINGRDKGSVIADLSGQNLSGVDLRCADLSNVKMDNTNLSHAKLNMSNLQEASFLGADLRGVDLIGAQVSGMQISKHTKGMSKKPKSNNAYGLLPIDSSHSQIHKLAQKTQYLRDETIMETLYPELKSKSPSAPEQSHACSSTPVPEVSSSSSSHADQSYSPACSSTPVPLGKHTEKTMRNGHNHATSPRPHKKPAMPQIDWVATIGRRQAGDGIKISAPLGDDRHNGDTPAPTTMAAEIAAKTTPRPAQVR